MPVLEAMVIRVCGGAIVGGVKRSLFTSTIRGASGPIRYNPKVPASAKPTHDAAAAAAAGVSHSRPRWKQRAPPKTDQERGLREQDDAGTADASAEMQRLKAEMQLRDSSTQSTALIPPSFSQQTLPVDDEEEEGVPAITRIPNVPAFGNSSLFYGDGRKFEGLTSKMNPSGLFYGDGRKFKIDDSNPNPLFETVEMEDKTMAKEKQAAKNYALRLLGMAPQTAHKLRQKLIGRSVSAPVIESTIADLQRCGLQSDLEYAEAFARSRWRSALWGPQRLKQELKQRGVCPEDVATALEKVFNGTEDSFHDEADNEGKGAAWGMTREAREHLMEKARLQWARGGSHLSAEARKRRMIGWLQRRGFNWSITSLILKSLESAENNNNNNNKLVD